ncbi:ATP-binding protein [Chitinophaga cymbidii]|uniref:ATPase n=1 Tax=Chitinophaga cymbidii TaxID=1096750 RepID=A0A512RPR6_9BACT|nr:ATP-binding protein [Chitinophaga cymbidii]GEP97686.1 ATPase [Chitinophaga cymbidii]
MTPSALADYLQFAICNNFPVLIKGKPGIGKSDIVSQAAAAAQTDLIISHPVVSDPTDYKGLPFPNKNGTADFLPFGELRQLINASRQTVFFLDDLGQAPPSVQAACMQLLLARRINGHQVSDQVTFLAATNRREDKAAVGGLLEPVKSRFAAIVELEVNTDDWIKWALQNDMPTELIAFIRFRPELLDDFQPSRDIVNSPSPRTITAIGRQQQAALPERFEFEAFKGAAGEAFAAEYRGFLKMYRELPSMDEIILNPASAPVPREPGAIYAIAAALSHKMTDQNIGAICTYLDRLPLENAVASMKDAATTNRLICNNRAYIQWASDHSDALT